jgi:hypothetical protein
MARSTAVTSALTKALQGVERETRDGAAVALARQYARAIDADPTLLWRVGPRLLDVLVELKMTPRARQAVVKGGAAGDGDSGGAGERQQRRAALHALQSDHDGRAAGEH